MTHKAIFASAALRSLSNFTFLPSPWRKQLDLISGATLQPYVIVAFTLWLVGAVEIIQKTSGQRLDPRFWMGIAVLITAYSGVRIFRLSPYRWNVRASRRSAAADAVISGMTSSGFAVYHEPAQAKGSDAYIAVGRAGVYAMELKARNAFGSRTIEVRKENELLLGGRIADCRPLTQVRAAAHKIREKLEGILRVQDAVKSLVVFPDGWRINQSDTGRDITVVTANDLQQYLAGQEAILTETEVEEISSRLSTPAFAY